MKCALVTGGSRGIGRAISVKMAELGYHVLVNYVSNEKEALHTVELVKEKGSTAETIQFNVSDRAQVDAVLGQWVEAHKDTDHIEVLVNNAGIRQDALMVFMKPEEWDNVLGISLGGFYNVTKHVLQGMLIKRYGRIVNVVSLSGIKGMPGQTNYSAAKAGVIGATKALAQEVGKRGVTVNAVAPGFIKTDMTEDIKEEDYKAMIPTGRFGKPEEVAEVVGFLASKACSYTTGEVISVNGGLHT
ncbi:MAG: 3-oxoacyl-ACP reductase FabG [Cytophagales bacterium]|nr:3-oxoacyl-ACP reductase FabG [Cytophagales bacterium]